VFDWSGLKTQLCGATTAFTWQIVVQTTYVKLQQTLSLILQMQHMYCWGGSVSGWFSGWMVRNDHPYCVFDTKNLYNAQNYSVIIEFLIKRKVISDCD